MKNRKKADRYRFNGNPYFHAGSIVPIQITDLEAGIAGFEAKLADPADPDDKKWVARWLHRFRRELEKKQAGSRLKQRERRSDRRRREVVP